MAEAGYPDGEGFPVVEYSANDAGYHIPVAEYVQQAWGELGITVNINKVEWASFLPMRRAGDYDISRNGWSMDYNDPSNMLELFTTNNGNNDGKYANPDFDKVIEESRVADKATHFEKLHEAEDMLMADAACIPVAYYNDFWLQSPSLKGTWHSPYGYWYLQYGYVEGVILYNGINLRHIRRMCLFFGSRPQRCRHHGFDGMHSVLGLLEYDGLRAVEYLVGHFHGVAAKFLAHFLAHGGLVVMVGG